VRRLDKVSLARLRSVVRSGAYETQFRGHFDKLVDRGLVIREAVPREYGNPVYRFSPTPEGLALIGVVQPVALPPGTSEE
jgi:hypothetical protein